MTIVPSNFGVKFPTQLDKYTCLIFQFNFDASYVMFDVNSRICATVSMQQLLYNKYWQIVEPQRLIDYNNQVIKWLSLQLCQEIRCSVANNTYTCAFYIKYNYLLEMGRSSSSRTQLSSTNLVIFTYEVSFEWLHYNGLIVSINRLAKSSKVAALIDSI